MVYGIVTQSGGALRVHSSPGQGTEVAIYLPWHAGPLASAAAGARREPVPGGAETVLLVEDDDAIRSLARRTLAAAGYTVLDAGSPSEALARARGHAGPLHLLLSDVILPQQNGWELSRSLVAERPAIRVLFMSGYAGNRLDGEAILPPDAPLLAKPFTPEELLRRVREAIGV
jgi:CheY-like chemotaxis protein